MWKNLLRHLCWIIIIFLQTSECRRYDIEQEAYNLYSINLKSVIERFRRTPDYLQILNDKMELKRKNTEAIIESTTFYYSDKLKEKVTEIFGANDTKKFRNIRQFQFNHILPRKKPRKKLRTIKKQGNPKSLDNYKKFRSNISIEQKNGMKELGFEFAGHAIHTMINRILPDGALPMSTLHPYAGDLSEKSTKIPHNDHEISKLFPPVTTATESTIHESTNHDNTHNTETVDDPS